MMTVSEIYTTSPTQGPEKVLESFALLDQLHIPYSRVEHEPAETMEACAAISDALGIRICKNLFLCNRQKTDFYLLTMPEDKPFHTKDLSAQIGSSRLSFAPPELMEELIHCTPGSASVLGLAYDTEHRVRLLMDRETYEAAQFGCHPCLNTGSLRCVQTDDMVNDIIAACIEADGILLAAPVYHGGISGNMKCVLDRLMLAAGCGVNQLHHKVGGALCTLRRSGGMETYQQLLGTMDAMEMVIVTSDYWGAVHGADPGEALKDEEGMEVAARLGRDMAWMVKVLAESRVPVPESTPRPMMNFIR